jgi:hypothetical protein
MAQVHIDVEKGLSIILCIIVHEYLLVFLGYILLILARDDFVDSWRRLRSLSCSGISLIPSLEINRISLYGSCRNLSSLPEDSGIRLECELGRVLLELNVI